MTLQIKSREEILAYLKDVLVELFELKPEQIVPEATLYDDLDIGRCIVRYFFDFDLTLVVRSHD